MSVDLPAPFGPSSPVTAGRDAHGHVVQADHLAVPLRQVVGLDDGVARVPELHGHDTTSTPRTRRPRIDHIDATMIADRSPATRRPGGVE